MATQYIALNSGDDYEHSEKWIGALEKIEQRAAHAMEAEHYEKAVVYYEDFIRAVDGKIDSRKPSILWVERQYSEALMKSHREVAADEIQEALLDRLDSPENQEEREIIEEVLTLRLKRAVTLHAQAEVNSLQQATDILWRASLYSASVLGRKNIMTTTILDNLKVLGDDKSRLTVRQVKKEMREQSRSPKPSSFARMDPVIPSSMLKTPPPVPRTPKPSIRLPVDNKIMYQPPSEEATNTGSLAPVSVSLSPLLAVRHDETQFARDRRLSDSQVRAIQSPFGGITRDGPAARPRSSSQRPGAEEVVASQEIVRSRSAQGSAPKQQKGTTQPQSLSDARLLSGSPDDCTATDNWFMKYLSKCHTLLDMYPLQKSAPGKRVRIAIIDTGLNRHHPEVATLLESDEEEQRIKACESWLSDSSRGGFLPGDEDEAGHGTHCAMVAHKVAPNADIFVARVFKNEDNVVGTYVTDAINHAVKVWKVDIISMSFALSSRDKENNKKVSMAIEEATARGCPRPVLFFAAASNDGKNAGTTFPATHRDVTCMYAAKGGGAFVWDMNPDMLLDDANFSALGMYVDAPHRGSSNQRMSGTSVATPVAAGIAALVLEFVRQRRVDGQQPITVVGALKTKRGMMRAFWLMRNRNVPTQIPKGEPFNLKPWYLLGSEFNGGDDDTAREAARIDIASDLNRALAGLDP